MKETATRLLVDKQNETTLVDLLVDQSEYRPAIPLDCGMLAFIQKIDKTAFSNEYQADAVKEPDFDVDFSNVRPDLSVLN